MSIQWAHLFLCLHSSSAKVVLVDQSGGSSPKLELLFAALLKLCPHLLSWCPSCWGGPLLPLPLLVASRSVSCRWLANWCLCYHLVDSAALALAAAPAACRCCHCKCLCAPLPVPLCAIASTSTSFCQHCRVPTPVPLPVLLVPLKGPLHASVVQHLLGPTAAFAAIEWLGLATIEWPCLAATEWPWPTATKWLCRHWVSWPPLSLLKNGNIQPKLVWCQLLCTIAICPATYLSRLIGFCNTLYGPSGFSLSTHFSLHKPTHSNLSYIYKTTRDRFRSLSYIIFLPFITSW